MKPLWIVPFLVACSGLPGRCADWNPHLAADYLDAREKAWFGWYNANKVDKGPCISCHTGIPYLLVRPALRRALGETGATSWEQGLMGGMRARAGTTDPLKWLKFSGGPLGPRFEADESIFAALFFAIENSTSQETDLALKRMWSQQLQEGEDKGAWPWLTMFGDPWSGPDSTFYGATLAALAVGYAPAEYRNRPDVREHIALLTAYFDAKRPNQPLHNRIALVWASTKLPGILPDAARRSVIEETRAKQQADGGWTMESLGPWKEHPKAPPAPPGSSSYATAFVACALQTTGVKPSDPGLAKALNWLRSHQDRQNGYWDAVSMNKTFEADSMPVQFMRDAATGYAALALLEAGDTGK